MTKMKVTISLDSEIAGKLRLQSIEKYHNSRSMSRYIEDLAAGAAATVASGDTGSTAVLVNGGLTEEEKEVLDNADSSKERGEIGGLSAKACSGNIWDRFYECPGCYVKFELFGATYAPKCCPICGEANSIRMPLRER
jgi:hypothetical protein